MAKRKQTEYIQGHATHRRTEGDYMGVLLDAVTLDDWRGVVTGALQAAIQVPAAPPNSVESNGYCRFTISLI